MTEPIVSLCKIFNGSTDEANFFAKENIVMPPPAPLLPPRFSKTEY